MPRMNLRKTHKLGMAAVLGLEAYCRSHTDKRLYELIKLRASQLNRCGFCIAMHTEALVTAGESAERIAGLAEPGLPSGVYSPAEQAALGLTEAVTRLGDGVPDEVWEAAAEHFSETQLGNLVLAIATINVWNRIGIATRLDA